MPERPKLWKAPMIGGIAGQDSPPRERLHGGKNSVIPADPARKAKAGVNTNPQGHWLSTVGERTTHAYAFEKRYANRTHLHLFRARRRSPIGAMKA